MCDRDLRFRTTVVGCNVDRVLKRRASAHSTTRRGQLNCGWRAHNAFVAAVLRRRSPLVVVEIVVDMIVAVLVVVVDNRADRNARRTDGIRRTAARCRNSEHYRLITDSTPPFASRIDRQRACHAARRRSSACPRSFEKLAAPLCAIVDAELCSATQTLWSQPSTCCRQRRACRAWSCKRCSSRHSRKHARRRRQRDQHARHWQKKASDLHLKRKRKKLCQKLRRLRIMK